MTTAEKLQTIAENVPRVYEAGKEAGEQSHNEWFWSEYLKNTSGAGMFAGNGWNENTCKPPKGIVLRPTYPYMMFYGCAIQDLDEWCKRYEVTLDFSNASYLTYTFYYGGGNTPNPIKRIGVLDFSGAIGLTNTFAYNSALEYIEKIILKGDGSTTFNGIFLECPALTHCVIEGTIGKNGFSTSQCPLDKESLTSIVNALSLTTLGLTVTVNKASVDKAFETSTGANDGSTSPEWLALVATRSNWTILLS